MENKQDKGFTLVELLIVIVILGILATVTVFAVRGITDQGRNSSCATDKRTLEVAIEAFYAKNGTTTHPTAPALQSGGFIVAAPTNYTITQGTTSTATPPVVVYSAIAVTSPAPVKCNLNGTAP